MSNWKIPLSDLNYGVEEELAIQRVLKSKWLSMGPEVEAFEHEFAGFIDVKHAVAVANATVALHLALVAAGVRPGDEVIQPALNFVAAGNMTLAVGAIPVFADIVALEEPTIDPDHVRELITNKTKAVIAMHYGGYVCRMRELLDLCTAHELLLIEDACHAPGARFDDGGGTRKMAGSIGDVAAFSFFGNKNIATGEGGMITTNRDDVAAIARSLRSHGMTTLTWDRDRGHASSYDVIRPGFNYRLDELHAALGREQLKKLQQGNHAREGLVRSYRASLEDTADLTLPFANYEGCSAYHLMAVVCNSGRRDKATEHLKQRKIQTSLHYPAVPDFQAFAEFRSATVPITRAYSQSAVTLPLYPTMPKGAVSEVCDAVKAVMCLTEAG